MFQSKIKSNQIRIDGYDKHSLMTYKEYMSKIVLDKPTIDRYVKKIEILRKEKYIFLIKIHVITNTVYFFLEYNCKKKWDYESEYEKAKKELLQ